jgi:hypothetical protein
MSIEACGKASRLDWRARAPAVCVGRSDSPVEIQKCDYMAEPDMQTFIWGRAGAAFFLQSRALPDIRFRRFSFIAGSARMVRRNSSAGRARHS